jgi:hypothetical protein
VGLRSRLLGRRDCVYEMVGTLVTNSISSTTLLDFFDQVTFYNFFIGNFTHAPSGFLK